MVAQSIFWLTLPAVVYGLLASFVLRGDPPPRWQSRAADVVDRWRTRRADRRSGGTGKDGVRPQHEVDPFDALSVQIRLGVIAAQLRSIEDDPRIWARARRFQATQHAYDDLLAQACRLAGIDLDEAEHRYGRNRTEPERLREEVELASRGWTW